MIDFRKSYIIFAVLAGCCLLLSADLVQAESLQGVRGFISPKVNIEKTAFKGLVAEIRQKAAFEEKTQDLAFARKLAETQPLSIAEKMVKMAPKDAAIFILNNIPVAKTWNVLKKIPAENIAVILDSMTIDDAAFIIQQMRPLKAGLVLNAMKFKESVFFRCGPEFRSTLLNTPGPKQIVHATIEEADFFRCGGLADVLKNLPKEIAEQGDIPSVFMPLWQGINKDDLNYVGSFSVPIDSESGYRDEQIYLHYAEVGDLIKYKIYFIENHTYFDVDKSGVFTWPMFERFILMSKAILEGLRYIDSSPDIIQCHEWQTGLIPVYLKAFYKEKGIENFKHTKSVYTSHNPAYDTKGPWDTFYKTGLDEDMFFQPEGLEIYNEWSFSKAGLWFADVSNTVSISMAEDAKNKDFIGTIKNDLKGVYQYLDSQDRWFGIVNGGNEHFRAEVNKKIPVNFDADNLDLRRKNKIALQQNLGLEVDDNKPIIATIGRLTSQKGYDLLWPIVMDILERGGQIVTLGGPAKTDPAGLELQDKFEEIIEHINSDPEYEKYRNQISMNFTFGREFADGTNLEALICGGADIIAVPSRFEPCGLVQINAAGCGGVVVAHNIQGLADTITPYISQTGQGLGFLFDEYSAESFKQALFAAMDIFEKDKDEWQGVQKNNLNADFTWDPVVWEYRKLIYSKSEIIASVLNFLPEGFAQMVRQQFNREHQLLPMQSI